MKQQIEYGIFLIEQVAEGLFNRAALMNIGYVESQKLGDWDCFIFHDIDLLPLDDRNLYNCPDQPRHMSVAVDTMGFKYVYSNKVPTKRENSMKIILDCHIVRFLVVCQP